MLAPKPVQRPYPPIWVGGESPPALRRAARVGAAWYPIGTNRAHPYDTLARLEAGIARLRAMEHAIDRPAGSVSVAYRVKRLGAEVAAIASDGQRRLFSGDEAAILGDLRALAALGVSAIDVDIERTDPEATLAELRRLRALLARV